MTSRRSPAAPRTHEAFSGWTTSAPTSTDIELDIRVASPSPEDRVDAMLAAWRERCPIYLALLKPRTIQLSTVRADEAG